MSIFLSAYVCLQLFNQKVAITLHLGQIAGRDAQEIRKLWREAATLGHDGHSAHSLRREALLLERHQRRQVLAGHESGRDCGRVVLVVGRLRVDVGRVDEVIAAEVVDGRVRISAGPDEHRVLVEEVGGRGAEVVGRQAPS